MSLLKHVMMRFFAKVLASACLMFAVVFFTLSSVNAPCTSIQDMAVPNMVSTQNAQTSHVEVLCNRDNRQISWVMWLFKEPQSAQTYFFDFLELLTRKAD